MSRPRLVLVARRFWPLVGGTEVMLARLATAVQARGFEVTVATAHWQADWPKEFDHGGVRVVRLAAPGRTLWSQLRWWRAIARWLAAQPGGFDAALASGLRQEAYAVLWAARRGRFPVVIRAEGFGAEGDCHWQLEAACGWRIKRRCCQAAAVVGSCRSVERELIAAGYPRDRIQYIPDGVPIPPLRGAGDRSEARLALAESEPSLAGAEDELVAVYVGRLAAGKGLDTLLEAWRCVTARRAAARLWFVGDGPLRQHLAGRARELGLAGRVTLAGAYDDVDDFWRAADLFVLPGAVDTASLALREAMAWGLPVVAADSQENRLLIEDGRHGRLVPPGDAEALALAVDQVWENPAAAGELGRQARLRVAAEFSLDATVEKYLCLLEAVIRSQRKGV